MHAGTEESLLVDVACHSGYELSHDHMNYVHYVDSRLAVAYPFEVLMQLVFLKRQVGASGSRILSSQS